MKSRFVAIALLSTLVSCVAAADKADWIQWDRATDKVVSHTDKAAAYPRAKRLSNGEILLGYHHGGGLGDYGTWVTLRKSRDNGASWYSTRDVEGPEGEDFWGFSNVDFVELGKGRVLLVTAGRGKALPGQPQFQSECERSELRLRFSDDYGDTWGSPIALSHGRGRLWEPTVVRLPDGELEIYYANESLDLQVNGRLDQRIEVIRSRDDGLTWSAPVEVSQHRGSRNGMPAAIVLKNGRVAVAQEMVRETYSPWITQNLDGRPVGEYIAQRRYSFGAAPFLLNGPSNTTLLAFHSGFQKPPAPANASLPWMFTYVWVQLGNAEAGDFGPASRPWPDIGPRSGTFFPSLLLKDEHTVVALASFITQADDDSSRTEVRWIEGKLTLPEKTLHQ